MRLEIQLRLPADARLLTPTRRAIAAYLDQIGVDGDVNHEVVLALDEACTNVIKHAFPDGRDGVIELRVEIDDNKVVIEVEDEGTGFEMARLGRIGTSEHELSGRGLHLIRELMTEVELESPTASGGTRLRMTKTLAPAAPLHTATG